MKNLNGKFINAILTSPKEKAARVLMYVLVDSPKTSKNIGGEVKEIWVPVSDSQNAWALIKECSFGESIELEARIESFGKRDSVSWVPVAIG